MKKIEVEFIGLDNFHHPIYKCDETEQLFKDVNQGRGEPELYDCGNQIEGDVGFPMSKDFEITYATKYKESARSFDYQFLGRLEQDCRYFLAYGNRYIGHLWAKNVDEQIAEMKRIHNSFSEDEKPEWLTMEEIENYEKLMKEEE